MNYSYDFYNFYDFFVKKNIFYDFFLRYILFLLINGLALNDGL